MSEPIYQDPNYEGEFGVWHCLYDMLLLLGAPKHIAELMEVSKDRTLNKTEIAILRNYSCELFCAVKGRLAYVHRMKIQPQPRTEEGK